MGISSHRPNAFANAPGQEAKSRFPKEPAVGKYLDEDFSKENRLLFFVGFVALLADFALFGRGLTALVVALLASVDGGFTARLLVIGGAGRDTH